MRAKGFRGNCLNVRDSADCLFIEAPLLSERWQGWTESGITVFWGLFFAHSLENAPFWWCKDCFSTHSMMAATFCATLR